MPQNRNVMLKLKINLSEFNNTKLLAFGEALYNAVAGLTGIDTVLLPFQKLYKQCVDAANNVLEKTKAKDVSERLKEEDNARDDLIIGINTLFDACEYHPETAVRDAAIELNQMMAKLGNKIYRETYDSESRSIKTLLLDLTGDYAPQVATCSATPYVDALEESQERFDQFRSEQLDENVETSQIVSMSTIRREFKQNIRAILELLPVMYQVNQDPEFKKAIDRVQQLILKF